MQIPTGFLPPQRVSFRHSLPLHPEWRFGLETSYHREADPRRYPGAARRSKPSRSRSDWSLSAFYSGSSWIQATSKAASQAIPTTNLKAPGMVFDVSAMFLFYFILFIYFSFSLVICEQIIFKRGSELLFLGLARCRCCNSWTSETGNIKWHCKCVCLQVAAGQSCGGHGEVSYKSEH